MDNLNVENARIVTAKGRPIHLRGVNLGNWLLLEGYMLCGPNKPERSIRRSIAREHGPQAARTFFR
ncbi:MAG: hypothetical protein HY548_01215, partial [Elusimicrobia bacterium]|nr:hypothetical protein [Elusimicrobiota bacterium]